jgi:hypothetical protein
MSNLLSDMPFLPQTAPAKPIVDCAGILPPARLSQLEAQASQVYFKPYVVILPTNYSPASMALTSSNIVQQWKIPDDAFLMVINLHGHNLRIVPGAKLKNEGLNDRKITQIIATKFGPPMRTVHSGDGMAAALPDAISNTIDGVNETVGHGRTTLVGKSGGIGGNDQLAACPGGNLLIPGAIIVAVVLSYLYLKQRKQ